MAKEKTKHILTSNELAELAKKFQEGKELIQKNKEQFVDVIKQATETKPHNSKQR